MSDKLEAKPCPTTGCGGETKLHHSSDGEASWVRCQTCGLEGKVQMQSALAVEAWNMGYFRTPTPEQAGEVEKKRRARAKAVVEKIYETAGESGGLDQGIALVMSFDRKRTAQLIRDADEAILALQSTPSAPELNKSATDPANSTQGLAKDAQPTDSEPRCELCGGPYGDKWRIASPLWNAVMRGGSIDGPWIGSELVCPSCFITRAEEMGAASGWRLSADTVTIALETVTPSGRVWNERTQLWDDPAQPTADAVERVKAFLKPIADMKWRNGRPEISGETAEDLQDEATGLLNVLAALPTMSGDYVMVPRDLMREAQFLCDRLDDLEWGLSMDEFANLHAAHVDPSHSRLKGLLAASPTGGE